ncbi:hypothetical protein [Clostridium sp. FP2]|nr:hypothetical protein [Clostridium sp. FP2]
MVNYKRIYFSFYMEAEICYNVIEVMSIILCSYFDMLYYGELWI